MKISVDGVPYEMPDNFTFREMARIKRITGLRAGELFPALAAGDTDVALSFAITAMSRTGLNVDEEKMWDLDIEKIDIDLELDDEEAAVDGPPADAAETAAPDAPSAPPSSLTSTTESLDVSGVPA